MKLFLLKKKKGYVSSREGRGGVQGSSHSMNKFVKDQIIIMYCKVHRCTKKSFVSS